MKPSSVIDQFGVGIRDRVLARSAARVILEFERFRLARYESRAGNPNRIATRAIGSAWALRFPAVGYFNQVQGLGDAEAARLDEFDAFYREIESGYKVQVAPEADRAGIFSRLADLDFEVATESVRLVHTRPKAVPLAPPEGLTLASLQAHEVNEFFLLYLECFGATSTSPAAALANLSRLPGQPGLHCILARMHGRVAGLGMLFISEGVAYFCAGAVRSAWRRHGLQAILLNERLRLAAEAGCELAVAWTEAFGASHRNLCRAGFTLAYHDPIWAARPRSDS